MLEQFCFVFRCVNVFFFCVMFFFCADKNVSRGVIAAIVVVIVVIIVLIYVGMFMFKRRKKKQDIQLSSELLKLVL